jgi:phage tail sheath protein FI
MTIALPRRWPGQTAALYWAGKGDIAMYQHPGVYIEHVPSNALAVEAASTSVTAFIGMTGRGGRVTATRGAPVFVTSVGQYAAVFGPLGGGPGGIQNRGDTPDPMGHAVNLYFANGGTKAYIVPVAGDAGTAGTLNTPEVAAVPAVPAIPAADGNPAVPAVAAVPKVLAQVGMEFTAGSVKKQLKLTAASAGVWADGLMARLGAGALAGEFTLTLGTRRVQAANTPLQDATFETVLEAITGLTGTNAEIAQRIDQLSTLVTAEVADAGGGNALPRVALMSGGVDAAAPKPQDYSAAFDRLRDYRDVSIMVLPGQVYKAGTAGALICDSALTHAELMQNRLVILDPDADTALVTPADVQAAGLPTSSYGVFYYPQVTVANPYFDADTAASQPRTFGIGPAGVAAGMWARIDATRGVWKAPAGLEATVRGTFGPTRLIGNDVQDNLNDWGVNCLRMIVGPTVIWGARTLATKSRPQFRYISVRRTQSMIGESLYRALQSVVFEPNDHKLWGSLRASVGDFMDGLHRAGAFQGEKASDAFFVRCGLGSTMTQGDIDAGVVRVAVGFAPLKPAEFVVVEIQQIVGQTA